MNIRKIRTEDAEKFFEMCCQIDEETRFMMFESGERRQRVRDLGNLKQNIDKSIAEVDFVLVAEDEDELVGFMSAQRGEIGRAHV